MRALVAWNQFWIHRLYLGTSFCLAEVSRNCAFQHSASFFPSSVETALSWCKSVLFPTNTTGTLQSFKNHKSALILLCLIQGNVLSLSHDVQQLLVDDLNDFERLLAGDRVHQHVPVEVHAVLGGEYAVLILTGGVHQFYLVVGWVDACDLGEGCER